MLASHKYTAFVAARRPFSLVRGVLSLLAMNDAEFASEKHKMYPWDELPYEDLRTRAAFIRAQAKCPTTGKLVQYVCPISGIPTHHLRQAWEDDHEYQTKKTYNLLKKVNLYEHDLRLGRQFDEFVFPGAQERDCVPNLLSWDAFFYTRDFAPMNTEFNLAAATKILTYPITVASIFHQYSPYLLEPKGPLTVEGLRSLSALRYTLYPPYLKLLEELTAFKDRPMRIFIVGSKMESMLPGYVWKQMSYLFPELRFEIHFVGPECYFDPTTRLFLLSSKDNGRPVVERVDEQLSLYYHTMYFDELYDLGDVFPFDPYLDCFFCFHPGFTTADEIHWDKALKGLLELKCPIYVTGYHQKDAQREFEWLQNHPLAEEMDVLMSPTENIYGSTKLDLVDINPTETFQANKNVFAVRGKRYHAVRK